DVAGGRGHGRRGGPRPPPNWRRDVRSVLFSLLRLRWAVLRLAKGGWLPKFGAQAVALSYVEDLALNRPHRDVCTEACPLRRSAEPHGHFLVAVGYGFLGALESFATGRAADDRRRYDFTRPPGGEGGGEGAGRRRDGRRIVSVHQPLKL